MTTDPLEALLEAKAILDIAEPEYEREEKVRDAFWAAQAAVEDAIECINKLKYE